MQKKHTKIISVILSIALVMSMCCVALASVSAATDDVWYVAGSRALCNGQEWLPGAEENKMTYNEETGLYEITFSQVGAGATEEEPFSFEFKVTSCTDSTWSDGVSYPNETDNFKGAISAQDDVKITLDAETGEVDWYSDSAFVITSHTYRVAGDSALCGSNWSAADNNNKMTYNEETGRFEKVYTNVEAKTYKWKITMDGATWIPAGMGNDQSVTVATAGSTVTIWYDEVTGEYDSEVTVPETEPTTEPESTTAPETEPTTEAPEPITFVDGPFTFTTTSASTAKLTKFDGSVEEVVIPETVTYDGVTYTVTETNILSNISKITSLSIPGTIKKIPNNFCNGATATKLTKITLNEGIEIIGEYAFTSTCAEEIILPSTINTIQRGAFQYSDSLKKVVINSDVYIMSDSNSPFVGSKNATYYLYSMNNTFGGKYPFPQTSPVYVYPGSTADTELSSSIMIRYIGVEGPQKGETFDVDGNTYKVIKRVYGDDDIKANLTAVSETASEFTVPASVTCEGIEFSITIGTTAFSSATSLTKLVLPEDVTTVSSFARFTNCTELKDIYVYNDSLTLKASQFNGLDLTQITIYGNEGSAVQTFAKENEINFVLLSEVPTTEPVTEPETTVPETEPPVERVLGDVDSDGSVTIKDAALIQLYLAKLLSDPSTCDLTVADYNCDGDFNIKDAALIQLVLAKLAEPVDPQKPTTEPETTQPETIVGEETTAPETESETSEPETSEPETEPTTEETTATSPTDAVDEDAWKSNTGQIILSNSGITVSGDGISVEGNIVTISDGGDWEVIGTCDDGMIYVDTGEVKDVNDKVKLRLNGMSLTNTSGPAIYFDRCKKAFITIESGSENYVADSSDYAVDYSEAKAAIHSDDSLEIKGKGTLNVTGNYSHAVNSDDDILIENGVINILSSVKDGLHANDAIDIIGKNIILTTNTTGDAVESEGYLTVESATLNFTASAKGLNAGDYITLTDVNATMNTDNDCINSNAAVTVSGGTYDLESGDDGITGLSIAIESGTFDIKATGKGLNDDEGNTITTGDFTIDSTDDCINSNGAIAIYDGTFELESDDDAITGDTISITGGIFLLNPVGKGIKSTTDTALKGGDYTINSTDDALHTNGNMTIDGGTYMITSGDDGVHADTTLTINDCTMTITKSYEGLEGCDVIINGGTISVVSTDDGINAAGGSDSSSQNTRPGGQGGSQFNPGSSSNSSIQINGGYISVVASGDGIDSNGALTFAGGVTLVQDLTNGGDFAIDADSTITFSGGVVMAVCSSNSMWQDITSKLSGGAVINQSVGSVSTSTVFAVKDSSDNVLSALQSKLSGSVGIVYYNSSSTASTVSTGGSYSGTLDDFGYGSGGSYIGGNSYTLSTSSSSGNFGPGGR